MKIIGKIVILPLIADITVGTTVYIDDEGLHLYDGKLLLSLEYPYSLTREEETEQTIPITRISNERDGFSIDFTKASLPLPQRTIPLERWNVLLQDPNYIGPYDVGVEIYDIQNYHQYYSRLTFLELSDELSIINTNIYMESDVEEARARLKVLRTYMRQKITAMSPKERDLIREKFTPTSHGKINDVDFNLTGDPVLHTFLSDLLEANHDYANMELHELELLLSKYKYNEDKLEECGIIRDMINQKKKH